MTMTIVELSGEGLAPADVVAIARDDAAVALGERGRALMQASAAAVQLALRAAEPADGTRADTAAALAQFAIEPLTLIAKEGLACINGTDGMLGMLVLAAHDLARLLRIADITAAMSVEALLGTDRVFDADLVALR